MTTTQQFRDCPQAQPSQQVSVGVALRPKNKRQISHYTRTYSIAAICRSKLGTEANRADHHLRRLVCHANMLDKLMDELVEAQRKKAVQASSLLSASPRFEQPRKIQWIDQAFEDLQDDADSDDQASVSGSESDDDLSYQDMVRKVKKGRSPPPQQLPPSFGYFDSDEDASDDDSEDCGDDDKMFDERVDGGELNLQRCRTSAVLRNPGSRSDAPDRIDHSDIIAGLINLRVSSVTNNAHITPKADLAKGVVSPAVA